MISRRHFCKTSLLFGAASLFTAVGQARATRLWLDLTNGRLATDVATSPDGTSVWVVGRDARPGGYGLYRYNLGEWELDRASPTSAGVRIAVDPRGQLWVVSDVNEIWRRTSETTWQQMPGAARDIGIGGDGTVWVLGVDAKPGGYGLWRWTGRTWVPDEASTTSAGVRISVDARGQPWVVSDSGEIWRRNNATSWSQLPGVATDIGIGAGGSVWVVGTNPKAGGYGLWHWTGSTWIEDSVSASSAGLQIAVDGFGQLWVVSSNGEIWLRGDFMTK